VAAPHTGETSPAATVSSRIEKPPSRLIGAGMGLANSAARADREIVEVNNIIIAASAPRRTENDIKLLLSSLRNSVKMRTSHALNGSAKSSCRPARLLYKTRLAGQCAERRLFLHPSGCKNFTISPSQRGVSSTLFGVRKIRTRNTIHGAIHCMSSG
jgi:hypothetical protein